MKKNVRRRESERKEGERKDVIVDKREKAKRL